MSEIQFSVSKMLIHQNLNVILNVPSTLLAGSDYVASHIR